MSSVKKIKVSKVHYARSILTSRTLVVFIDVLNEMRIGQLSAQALELFKSLDRPLPESKIEPAEL